MLDSRWIDLARADDLFEVRELLHLSGNEDFFKFFSLPFGTESQDKSAVVGRAGYLFVNDGSNKWKDQLCGRENISEAVRADSTNQLLAHKQRFQEQNIPFRVVVIPEKDILYPDLSPNVGEGLFVERSVRFFSKLLGNIVIYPVDELAELSTVVNSYHTRNSHYNFFGGLVVFNAVLRSLTAPEFRDEVQTKLVSWPDDLSMKWVNGLQTRRRMLKKFYFEEEVVKAESHVGRYLIIRNGNARTQQPLIIFGDSYSWNPDAGLARFLALEYSEVHFVWRKQLDWELISKVEPAAVILESAERFLIKGLI